jgi:RNA recognition motif-containing protein
MGRKLYVGNLPYSVNEDQLTDMFSEVGQVDSVRVITDKFSGKSKGFGFVEMSTDKAAQDAIAKFNGQEFDGRAIVVNEARPQEERPRGGGGGYGGGGGGGGYGGGGGGYGGGGGGRGGRDRY